MTRPHAPLPRRAAVVASTLLARVQMLEARMDSSVPAQAGVIDPGYSSGDPQVTVGDDDDLTGPYQHLSSYTPGAGDTVSLQWVQGTWVILGRLA